MESSLELSVQTEEEKARKERILQLERKQTGSLDWNKDDWNELTALRAHNPDPKALTPEQKVALSHQGTADTYLEDGTYVKPLTPDESNAIIKANLALGHSKRE